MRYSWKPRDGFRRSALPSARRTRRRRRWSRRRRGSRPAIAGPPPAAGASRTGCRRLDARLDAAGWPARARCGDPLFSISSSRRSRSEYRSRCCLLQRLELVPGLVDLAAQRAHVLPQRPRSAAATRTSVWFARSTAASRASSLVRARLEFLVARRGDALPTLHARSTMPRQEPPRRVVVAGLTARRRTRRGGSGRTRPRRGRRHGRALLPVAHGRDLRVGHALRQQRAPHRLRTPLAETDVVLARAALVGVALEAHVARSGTSPGTPHCAETTARYSCGISLLS